MSKCVRTECFASDGVQRCQILVSPTRPDKPCPFFKTCDQYEADKARAHGQLVAMGRDDLIRKFEMNPQRKW